MLVPIVWKWDSHRHHRKHPTRIRYFLYHIATHRKALKSSINRMNITPLTCGGYADYLVISNKHKTAPDYQSQTIINCNKCTHRHTMQTPTKYCNIKMINGGKIRTKPHLLPTIQSFNNSFSNSATQNCRWQQQTLIWQWFMLKARYRTGCGNAWSHIKIEQTPTVEFHTES